MSTRLYPLYQKGNPQLRVFLPNFWMKLIRPTHNQPENVVQFKCSMEMTKFDVQNYLEKIYKVPVIEVRTRVDMGKTFKEPGRGYVIKRDDSKIAYVTLVRIPCTTPTFLVTHTTFFPAQGPEVRVPRYVRESIRFEGGTREVAKGNEGQLQEIPRPNEITTRCTWLVLVLNQ